jgi:hypothetical protein
MFRGHFTDWHWCVQPQLPLQHGSAFWLTIQGDSNILFITGVVLALGNLIHKKILAG